jgi:hypothetical protein
MHQTVIESNTMRNDMLTVQGMDVRIVGDVSKRCGCERDAVKSSRPQHMSWPTSLLTGNKPFDPQALHLVFLLYSHDMTLHVFSNQPEHTTTT